ncbi:HSP20-like chaperone [Infundibulicybe gibba]|nr:HSP20-like chaperone [Infundibulicybe gibba]
MTQHPEVLWAQRSSESDEAKNVLYMTVNLPDIQESTLQYDLQPTKLTLKTKTGDPSKGIQVKEFEFELEFFAEVVPELSTKKLTTRSFNLTLRKKEKKTEYWPRLTKEKVKNAFLKTDFSKWVDEDEQDGAEKDVEEDMDPMGGMGGMGGMPGMGGMGGMPGMGGMGGMPGMGGMGGMPGMGGGADLDEDGPDSDDDGPPPLEAAEPAK